MTQLFQPPPRPGLALGLLAALLLSGTACTAGPSPTLTPPAPTATARPPTAAPAPPPTLTAAPSPTPQRTAMPTSIPGLPVLHPAAARTGDVQVDAIIDAFLGSDVAGRKRLIRYVTTPCTTAQGGGGPPKCAAGQADGTPVEVFPYAATEGEYATRPTIDRILDFQVTGLYGVYRVPASTFRADYWPPGEYAVVLAGPAAPTSSITPVVQIILYVQDGAVVRLRRTPFAEPWPPAEAAGAAWVLAPVR